MASKNDKTHPLIQQQVNLNINEGTEFFAHEASVNFTPTQFILDFKSITPRIDPRSKSKPTFVLKHNVIMVDVFQAKSLLGALNKQVREYEEKFGEIKKPKPIAKIEKERASQIKKAKKALNKKKKAKKKSDVPSYLG